MNMGSTSDGDDFSDEQLLFCMISAMMYTFGDVKEPLETSVQVVYTILREQMDILLKDAEFAARLRGSSLISHEDILFLMRKNKAKLKHLLQYLEVLDIKPKLLMDVKLNGDEIVLPEGKKTRINMCMEYLASIEDCEEYTSILKDKSIALPKYAMRRLERRNLMTEKMTSNEYKEFSETLQVSFCPVHNSGEFKRWLLKNQVTKFSLTPLALTIIGFLVREVIAEIVEMALAIKTKRRVIQNPLNKRGKLFSASYKMIDKDKFKDRNHSTNVSKNEIDGVTKNRQDAMKSRNVSNKQIITLEDAPNKENDDIIADLSMGVSEKENVQNDPGSVDATDDTQNSLEKEAETTVPDVSPHHGFDEQSSPSTYCSKDSGSSNYVFVESSIGSDSPSSECANPITDLATTECSLSDVDDNTIIKAPDCTKPMDLVSLRSSFSDISEIDLKVYLLQHKMEGIQTPETNSNESPAFEDISENEEETPNHNKIPCSQKSFQVPQKISAAAKLSETLIKEAIKPVEIREAYVRFCEPSPLVYFFNNYPVSRKRKLYLGVLNDDV